MGRPDSDVRSIVIRLLRSAQAPQEESGRRMLDRFGPRRTALAAAGTVVAACTAIAPVASAAPAASPPPPSVSPPAAGGTIGGPQLAGRGVIVNYSPGPVPKLPGIKASAWVLADAGTGQVLAAK